MQTKKRDADIHFNLFILTFNKMNKTQCTTGIYTMVTHYIKFHEIVVNLTKLSPKIFDKIARINEILYHIGSIRHLQGRILSNNIWRACLGVTQLLTQLWKYILASSSECCCKFLSSKYAV